MTIDWGAQPLVITREQQLLAAVRVEQLLIEHPERELFAGITRDDLLVLTRATRGYHRDGEVP